MNTTQLELVCFDLDGTLLPLDTHAYLRRYAEVMQDFMAKHGIDLASFTAAFKVGSDKMIVDDDANIINADRFWNAFLAALPENAKAHDWKALFDQFYTEAFPGIGPMLDANPYANKAIKMLKEKGYRVALLTMPVFPLNAVIERMHWAGLDPDDFELITHLDNQTSGKPYERYYQAALDSLDVPAERAWMVGNNTHDDLECTKIGLECLLITDHLMNENNACLDDVWLGSMKDFYHLVESLPAKA